MTDPRLRESRAVGGPLDGIKLAAEPRWNGRVPIRRTGESSVVRYHDGHYRWSESRQVWEWAVLEADEYCRYNNKDKRTIHRWYATARPGDKCMCSKQLYSKSGKRASVR